jgi:O-antigen ligase
MTLKETPRRLTKAGLFLFAFGLPLSHVPAEFGIAFAFLGWLLDGVINKRWRVRWHFVFAPLIFYILWNILAAAISARPLHSLGAVADNEWALVMMLMLFWTVDDVKMLSNLVYTFLATSGVASLYAIWQVFGGVELYRGLQLTPMGWGFYRSVGFYGFYLTFAAFAMTVFFFASGFWVELKTKMRWFFGSLAAASFLAVVGTFARSIWLSFGAAIPLFAFTRGRRTGLIVTAALFIAVSAGILTVPAIRFRVESIVDISQNETRLNLWKTSLRIAEDHPVTGVGEDNWDYVFDRYRVDGYYDTIVHPHNDYLTVLVSSGVPGLLAFLAIWGVTLTVGFRASLHSSDARLRAIALGSTFSVVGLLVAGIFQNYYGTFINCLGWWFVTGLLFAARALASEEKGKDGENRQG